MNLLEKMIQEKLEQTKAEAEQKERIRAAKALHIAQQLQPLYDEFYEATKHLYVPAHEYQYTNYADSDVFEVFKDWGHAHRKLSQIKMDDLTVSVSNTNDHLFHVSIAYRTEFPNRTANQVREIVCEYIAKGISRGKYHTRGEE